MVFETIPLPGVTALFALAFVASALQNLLPPPNTRDIARGLAPTFACDEAFMARGSRVEGSEKRVSLRSATPKEPTQKGSKAKEGEITVGILVWIIVGLIAGVLAKIVMPGPDPGGIILTIIIGMVGALIGGFIMQSILGFGSGGFIWSILVATLGAIILLAIYRLITRQAT